MSLACAGAGDEQRRRGVERLGERQGALGSSTSTGRRCSLLRSASTHCRPQVRRAGREPLAKGVRGTRSSALPLLRACTMHASWALTHATTHAKRVGRWQCQSWWCQPMGRVVPLPSVVLLRRFGQLALLHLQGGDAERLGHAPPRARAPQPTPPGGGRSSLSVSWRRSGRDGIAVAVVRIHMPRDARRGHVPAARGVVRHLPPCHGHHLARLPRLLRQLVVRRLASGALSPPLAHHTPSLCLSPRLSSSRSVHAVPGQPTSLRGGRRVRSGISRGGGGSDAWGGPARWRGCSEGCNTTTQWRLGAWSALAPSPATMPASMSRRRP